MFAVAFDLGVPELVILAVLGLLLLGGLAAVALVVALAKRGGGRDDFGAG